MMDKEAAKPMAKDAIFRIYSMSKPIITAALLTLYEEGKFSLLDPVSKYLPEFANMRVTVNKTDPATGKRIYYTVPAERPITILDLMRHTSGMTNQGPKDEKGDLILPKLDLHTQPGRRNQAARHGAAAASTGYGIRLQSGTGCGRPSDRGLFRKDPGSIPGGASPEALAHDRHRLLCAGEQMEPEASTTRLILSANHAEQIRQYG